jgi:hypothetical protein
LGPTRYSPKREKPIAPLPEDLDLESAKRLPIHREGEAFGVNRHGKSNQCKAQIREKEDKRTLLYNLTR